MKLRDLALVVSVVPMIAGCHVLFGDKHSNRGDLPGRQSAEAFALSQVELGRRAIDQGNYAAAIGAFRLARFDPEQAADAANGMGVAYARLGRADLAVRFFREAVAIAPSDRRFQSNLARLERQTAARAAYLAALQTSRESLQSRDGNNYPVRVQFGNGTGVEGARPGGGGEPAEGGRARVVASAGGEGSAPSNAIRVETPEQGKGLGYPVRVTFSSPGASEAPAYPLRISLPGPTP